MKRGLDGAGAAQKESFKRMVSGAGDAEGKGALKGKKALELIYESQRHADRKVGLSLSLCLSLSVSVSLSRFLAFSLSRFLSLSASVFSFMCCFCSHHPPSLRTRFTRIEGKYTAVLALLLFCVLSPPSSAHIRSNLCTCIFPCACQSSFQTSVSEDVISCQAIGSRSRVQPVSAAKTKMVGDLFGALKKLQNMDVDIEKRFGKK